jgi:hypothetical protein
MHRKQLHSCQKKCYKTKQGCKYGFPYAINKDNGQIELL